MTKATVRTSGDVIKVDDDRRLVFAWFSVIEKGGEIVTDLQGDEIEPHELEAAVHDFMADSRAGGFMHIRGRDGEIIKVGSIVESMVLTAEKQQALGIDLGMVGWLGVYRVEHDDVWKAVKDGDFRAISIGGRGVRVPVEG